MIGPLSPRVDFLSGAIRLAQHVERTGDPGPQTSRLLWRFATNIPGAAESFGSARPAAIIAAARAELEVHDDSDRAQRKAAAEAARRRLDDVQQLFGAQPLRQSAALTDNFPDIGGPVPRRPDPSFQRTR